MARLFQLSEGYRKLYEQVEELLDSEHFGEKEEEELELFMSTLESIEGAIEVKIENINKMIKAWNADVVAYKLEESRLEKRRKAMENRVDRIKKYSKEMLENAKIEKIEGLYGARLQRNNPSVLIVNEKLIPTEYRTPQPDVIKKAEILKDLKEKKEITGAVIAPVTKHIRFL